MGRGHGGTRSGGAGGGVSDAAIAKMAQSFVEGKTLNPAEVKELLKGEIIIDHGYNRDTGKGWATNARSPEIEAMISNETGEAPAQPSTTRASNKVKEKYLRDYDAYHDRYMSAMSHGVSEYKKLIGRTKNAELKSLLANKVQTYQQYMSEAVGVRDWIHKNWRPK